MRPGMRLGEALATCPALELVEQDPATAEQAWEEILRRLEDAGFAVEPAEPGTVYFETRGVERLYGGLEPALKRALAAVGHGVGPAGGRGRAAVRRARGGERRAAGQALDRLRRPHAVVPRAAAADAAPARARALRGARGARGSHDRTACRAAGRRRRRTIGAGRPARLEPGEGRSEDGRVAPRRPAQPSHETLEFPEAVGNELTLRRGLAVLLDRLLARPERAGRPPRKLALWARLVGGASWRRTVTLREPTADPARLRAALAPKLAELPAPALKLRLEVVGARRAHRRAARARRRRGRGACRAGSARACARCARPSAQAESRRWWRSHRGRAFRRRARCSFRATTERAVQRAGPALVEAGTRTGTPRPAGQPAGGRARARGVARRRPLVDRRARRTAATSTSCSRPARTPSSTTTTTRAAWFTQRA